MLGDVSKAEEKFIKLVGGDPRANELLKRLSGAEAQRLSGNRMIDYLSSKFDGVKVCSDQLDDLFGKSGIIYLLSTRPHTNSESNFVKLVKNKVINKPEVLEMYLMNPAPNLPSDVKNIKDSLLRYLKLTDNEQDDKVPEEEAEVKDKLKRKNNKDVAEKMQSHRKADRLKIMVSVLMVKMIDNPQMITNPQANKNNPGGSKGRSAPQPKASSSYYDEFVKKFTEMEQKQDYSGESQQALYGIYANSGNTAAFEYEACRHSLEELKNLNRRMLKYVQASARAKKVHVDSQGVIQKLIALTTRLKQAKEKQ